MLATKFRTTSNSIIELPSPFETTYGVIKLLEPADCDKEKLLERVRSSNYDKPFIIDDGDSRSLYFSLAYVQSAMCLDNPCGLEFAYTRKMMSFLFFLHQPRNILLLGLGGGSLAKYCHRHLSSADITVVEIDPDVLAFRDQFLIPPDDSRFRVLLGDAAQYVRDRSESADVIMMDAFDRYGFAPSVSSPNFYVDVRDALTRRGVMVANLVGEKAERIDHLEMMRTAFDNNVIVLPVQDGGNYVAFAFRDSSFEPRWRWINSQAKAMGSRYGLDFPKFASKLERSRKLGYLKRIMHQPEFFEGY
ncbi:MAG TPA: fused MFS/spermidine synthase [Burkholderiales bacterium]|nr:fused MFS/spermidine synthase [Burkholderiales bacterium]